MERTLTHAGVADAGVPSASAWSDGWRRLIPLWRHAVWLMSLFAVLSVAASIRLDVQQMRKDLDRHNRVAREARILNDRLRLEVDARRRAVAMEQAAARLQLGPHATIVRVERATP